MYRHVSDKISTEFRGIFRIFVNFAGFRGSATARNIRSPDLPSTLKWTDKSHHPLGSKVHQSSLSHILSSNYYQRETYCKRNHDWLTKINAVYVDPGLIVCMYEICKPLFWGGQGCMCKIPGWQQQLTISCKLMRCQFYNIPLFSISSKQPLDTWYDFYVH